MKLSRTVTGLLSVALLAFMVSDTLGQDEGRRGGGRGGPGGGFQGGRGGPGFGGRGGPGGGGDNTMDLLQDEDVQVELQISPDQEEAITKMAEQARGGRGEAGGRGDGGGRGFADIREMSDEERTEFFAKRRKEQEERVAKMKEQLEEVLLPEQAERLEQIKLQVRGVQALNDEEIAGKLKITAEQKKKLTEVQEGVREKMGERMRELFALGDREAMREGFAKIGAEVEAEILDVLSSDQKKQFEEMKGEPFEKAAELRRGAGRGGFGGGRGGPGGGRGGFGGGRGGPGGGGGRGGRGGGRPQRPGSEE